jgi:hypothetical protein
MQTTSEWREQELRARASQRAPGESTDPRAVMASEPVKVIWGPIMKELNVQGLTVGAAYRALQDALGIPADALPLVNGRRAEPDECLVAGDVLEFVRRAGEKGAVDGR